MDVIARRAETTKRTLYAHFTDKEALFLAVFEFLKGFFLNRLRTPDEYSKDPTQALVLFCGRFMETLLFEGAIRMCRICAAESARFPGESAQEYRKYRECTKVASELVRGQNGLSFQFPPNLYHVKTSF
jgi:AcrR family transcriptional regulator